MTDLAFIPSDATGRWQIATRNSDYILDLDNRRVMRLPSAQADPLDYDGDWASVTFVEVEKGFPAVFQWLDGDRVRLRYTSDVQGITQLLEKEPNY